MSAETRKLRCRARTTTPSSPSPRDVATLLRTHACIGGTVRNPYSANVHPIQTCAWGETKGMASRGGSRILRCCFGGSHLMVSSMTGPPAPWALADPTSSWSKSAIERTPSSSCVHTGEASSGAEAASSVHQEVLDRESKAVPDALADYAQCSNRMHRLGCKRRVGTLMMMMLCDALPA